MKIAIITGATGGLGKEFVREVLKEDVDEIWAVARNENRLNELKVEFGNKIRTVRCDLGDADNLSELFKLIETEKPDIRLLINNAGIGQMGKSTEVLDDDIAKEIDLNCKSICLLH